MKPNSERKRSHHQIMGDGLIDVFRKREVNLLDYIKEKKAEKEMVVYIHVPYCHKICSFCSLRRTLNQPVEEYDKLVIDHLKEYACLDYVKNAKIGSIYFGGGTPTTLSAKALFNILNALNKYLNISSDCEISLETTLSELDKERLISISSAGANRLSIGVQTFNDTMRKIFNRRGDSKFAIDRIKQAKQYIDNVNIDIIYNYPNQTIKDIRRDIRLADELLCQGFSMYSLMNINKKEILMSDRNKEKEIFLALVDEAKKRGFSFHEVTKMVKKDEYKYIKLRLSGSDTIPLGAGAGGQIAGMPIMNPIDVNKYKEVIGTISSKVGKIKTEEYELLEIYKGYFQQCYIPLDLIEKYPSIKDHIEDYKYRNLIEEKDKKYIYTIEGVYWGNNISSNLVKVIATDISNNII